MLVVVGLVVLAASLVSACTQVTSGRGVPLGLPNFPSDTVEPTDSTTVDPTELAHVGDQVEIPDPQGKVLITLDRVADDVISTQNETPQVGYRFYGAKFTIEVPKDQRAYD
ncbi:MAG TPA: hypothetical protein VJ831_10530, partial [Jatrophihabitantaceae bacterium]|nr:hypothetical protein [Jatrophihabitantaceae bacterium]